MPCGDGTGPVWAHRRDWRCWDSQDHTRRLRSRYFQRQQFEEPHPLTNEEKKKILEEQIQYIEKEKQELEKRLKEIEP